MSEKSATTYAVLHLRFKLRVPPDVLLARSREAATIIASVEGLIWKIWVCRRRSLRWEACIYSPTVKLPRLT